jgi:regulator of sigma E protease
MGWTSNLLTNVVAFVIVLGLLVFFHELGHFLFAKLFKVRVFVFSFGFGKRLFGFKKGETDYRVSAIPLGGYVRMAGESEEEEGVFDEHDFLAKPKWQRFLILVAGPGANLIIALAFLAFLNMAGTEVLRDSRAILGVVLKDKPAAAAGLKPGDMIIRAGDERIDTWEDLKIVISMNPSRDVPMVFVRNGKEMKTTVRPERVVTDYGVAGIAGVMPFISMEVGRVEPGTAAAAARLRPGDRIVGAGTRTVEQWDDFSKALTELKGRPVPVKVQRGNQIVSLTLPPMKSVKENYPGFIPPTVIRKLPFGEAIRERYDQNVKMVKYTFATLARLFRMQGSVKDFSGPISIARISGEMLRTGWREVIFLMASISLQLGIMNLLPIPVLDGGHIFILLIEGVAGRELSMMTKERITKAGFAVLATLMIVVLFNDVIQNVMMLRRG